MQISCGRSHSAIIAEGGHVYTMGNNDYGQLGLNGKIEIGETQAIPNLVDGTSNYYITKVCCGDNMTACLTDDGGLFTWGYGDDGCLGIGSQDSYDSP